MEPQQVFAMTFAKLYPLYLAKVQRKGHTKEELDQVITWLTGYDQAGLEGVIAQGTSLKAFFDRAPAFNPNAKLITGVICGHRVEDIKDPLMQKIRYLDKLIDELARGKRMSSILRTAPAA
jgi:hypothetical protein